MLDSEGEVGADAHGALDRLMGRLKEKSRPVSPAIDFTGLSDEFADSLVDELRPLYSNIYRHNKNFYNSIARSTVDLINFSLREHVDSVFFLDKSARPAGYLFLKTWGALLPDQKAPKIRFLNIGQEKKEEIRSDNTEKVFKDAGDKIVVVDEFVYSGDTIVKAGNFVKKSVARAAQIFLIGLSRTAVPPWYRKSDILLVYDPTDLNSLVSQPVQGQLRNKGILYRKALNSVAEEIAKNSNRANSNDVKIVASTFKRPLKFGKDNLKILILERSFSENQATIEI